MPGIGLLDELGEETWLLVEDQGGDEGAAADGVFQLRGHVAEGWVGVGGVALEEGEVGVSGGLG